MSSDSDSDDYGDTEFITSTIRDTTAALKAGKQGCNLVEYTQYDL